MTFSVMLWTLLLLQFTPTATATEPPDGPPDNPPVALCDTVTVVLDANGVYDIAPSDFDAGSYDPDGDPITLSSPNCDAGTRTFTCGDVIWSFLCELVVDAGGASASCISNVSPVDVTPPIAICGDIHPQFDCGETERSVWNFDFDAGSSDECGIATMDITESTVSYPGHNGITMTVTDPSGNYAECIAAAYVATSPSAVCQDITIETGTEICPNDIDNGSSDLDGDPITLTWTGPTFTNSNACFSPTDVDVGTNSYTLFASDGTHECECSASVTVETAAPTTAAPTTALPTTASPTTASPTTASPTTASPTTALPTTASPTTASPTTASPTTATPTTTSRKHYKNKRKKTFESEVESASEGSEEESGAQSEESGEESEESDEAELFAYKYLGKTDTNVNDAKYDLISAHFNDTTLWNFGAMFIVIILVNIAMCFCFSCIAKNDSKKSQNDKLSFV